MSTINPAQNPKVEHRVREFLKALNSGGGKPMETMTPAEARDALHQTGKMLKKHPK